MRVTTSKSKHSESFYITKGFINDKGTSTSVVIRKLGTLSELLKDHGPTRDDVMAWAREEARLETLKYKEELKNKSVPDHLPRRPASWIIRSKPSSEVAICSLRLYTTACLNEQDLPQIEGQV
ncbi:MAG: hypothetical protein ACLSAC_07450 [Enterocloster bolteae]